MQRVRQQMDAARHSALIDLVSRVWDWSVPLERRDPAVRRRAVVRGGTPASDLEAGFVASLGDSQTGRIADLSAHVTTAERALGAQVSGVLERARDQGLRHPAAVHLRLSGAAGQSLGAFLSRGVRVELTGVANDYVGKLSLIHI